MATTARRRATLQWLCGCAFIAAYLAFPFAWHWLTAPASTGELQGLGIVMFFMIPWGLIAPSPVMAVVGVLINCSIAGMLGAWVGRKLSDNLYRGS